jgi:hypothetical protein
MSDKSSGSQRWVGGGMGRLLGNSGELLGRLKYNKQ